MSKHTPGQWKIYAPNEIYPSRALVGARGGQVSIYDAPLTNETEANARLIACAPELLALVERYASECGECGGKGWFYVGEGISGRGPDDVEPKREHCGECEDIRAAIAKATS